MGTRAGELEHEYAKAAFAPRGVISDGAIATALSGSPQRDPNEQIIKDQFVGPWRLVSLEARGRGGKIPGDG